MLEQEGLPTYDHGPIEWGEERMIGQAVEDLFDHSLVYVPEYPLPKAPPNLVRRFWFEKPTEGESYVPWRKLPDDIFSRAAAADACTRKIYQFNHSKNDAQTGATTLTPDDIRTVFQQEYASCIWGRQGWADFPVEFDLHDVYLCMEADMIHRYDQRQRYENKAVSEAERHANAFMIAWMEPVLCVVSQAIHQEVEE